MTQLLNEIWLSRIARIDYAFQPIVNIHSGVCYGYEALLRNHEAAGFSSIFEFFDAAYHDHVLHAVDLHLREKAITKFSQLEWKNKVKLFFNLDNRVLNSADYKPGNTLNTMSQKPCWKPIPHILWCISTLTILNPIMTLMDSARETGSFCFFRNYSKDRLKISLDLSAISAGMTFLWGLKAWT